MSSADKKVAVVSGGAGGIGAAVVSRLAQADFIPIILDKDETAGREVLAELGRQEGRGLCIALDATKKSDVQRAFDRVLADYRRVDVLVNLAGGALYAKLIQDFALREWREIIDVNLKSTFLCCQAVFPIMKAQRQGAIINTASNYAVTGSASRTAYSAAKAGIIAFTKSLAAELAPYGVRANVIAPGRTATPRVMGNYDAAGWAAASSQIPMGRTAEPAEIAEGVAFLAGDESLYMTGQTLHVNGGMVMP